LALSIALGWGAARVVLGVLIRVLTIPTGLTAAK